MYPVGLQWGARPALLVCELKARCVPNPAEMPTQEIYAVAWGLVSDSGGPYTLSVNLLKKLKSLGCAERARARARSAP